MTHPGGLFPPPPSGVETHLQAGEVITPAEQPHHARARLRTDAEQAFLTNRGVDHPVLTETTESNDG